MGKKLLVLALAAVMMFGVFGLAACTESLDEYKATKSQALQDYANAKGESNYCETSWEAIRNAVTDGKVAIEAAQAKPAVTKAYDDAKGVIDEVEDLGLEKKIIWNGTIADIVDNETILITIDKYFNAKEFTANDFTMVDIVDESFAWLTKTAYDEHIENGTLPDGFRHIIIFKIIDKGPQNLIDAIREIEKINFIHSVGPNSFDSPDDGPAEE